MKYLQRIIVRDKFYDGGKKLMGFLKRFFKGPRGMTKELEERGYHHLPATFQSPTLGQPIDKGKWQTCSGCGRQIPVVDDLAMQSDGSLSTPRTFTYVCPFCSHCHVGTRMRWNKALVAQKACHSCGTGLSKDYQCSKCGYPRGWMRVSCPFCGNEQPVFAAHFVAGCDLFTLECVECESRFESLCIC